MVHFKNILPVFRFVCHTKLLYISLHDSIFLFVSHRGGMCGWILCIIIVGKVGGGLCRRCGWTIIGIIESRCESVITLMVTTVTYRRRWWDNVVIISFVLFHRWWCSCCWCWCRWFFLRCKFDRKC